MNELAIRLEVKSSRPLYEQIYEYIKQEIKNGGLSFEERLPSTRMLAKHLQVSRSTVELAYEQLLSEGYIEAVPYRGYFVCRLDGLLHLAERVPVSALRCEETKEKYEFDFSPSGIDLNSFPHNTWKKLSRGILMENNKEFFQLGDPQGEKSLRMTIASYLHQARGVSCTAEQVIVGAGNDYLLMLLLNILKHPCTVAMENPTYKKAYHVLKSMAGSMVAVGMDQNGMDVKELTESGADIAYVMPSHQYPMGTVMPIRRRMQLLEWAAQEEGRYIIEDDYDSEFRYKGKPIPALQGFDAVGKVVYLGTFSRSIAPSIRISYMVLPDKLMEVYGERGRIFSSTVSRVDQMLISRFLSEGYYERHLNRMRAVYKGRHDVLLEELGSFSDICSISGENAGVHLLLRFTNGMSEAEAVSRAKEAGVRVYGLSDSCIGHIPEEPTVILGYANMEEDRIREAARRLRSVWKNPALRNISDPRQ